jgi:hypothetical protein
MEMLFILLAAGTVAFAAASALLLAQLNRERDRARREIDLRREQEAQLIRLQNTRELLERDLRELRWMQSEADAPRPRAGPESTARSTTLRTRPFRAVKTNRPVVNVTTAFSASAARTLPDALPRYRRDPFKNPVERDYLCVQQHLQTRIAYRELAREMSLSPQNAEQLMDLLAEQHMKIIDDTEHPSVDPVLRTILRSQIRQTTEAEIAELLGPASFKQFERFRHTLGEREQLRAIGEQLDAVNLSLGPQQYERLLAILIEEARAVTYPASAAHLPAAQSIERQNDWLRDYERRVTSRAAVVLSHAQLRHLDDYFDRQSVVRQRNALALNARREVDTIPAPLAGRWPRDSKD